MQAGQQEGRFSWKLPKWIVSITVSGNDEVSAAKFAELADASPSRLLKSIGKSVTM
jgi:hypothetical protein